MLKKTSSSKSHLIGFLPVPTIQKINMTNLTSNGEIPPEGMAGCNLIQPPDQRTTNLEVISGCLEPCLVRF